MNIQVPLPTFLLGQPVVTADKIPAIAAEFGLDAATDSKPSGNGSVIILEKGLLRLDVDLTLGRLWFADRARLWNPDAPPEEGELPGEAECRERGLALLTALNLIPPGLGSASIRPQWVDSTRCVTWRVTGDHDEQGLLKGELIPGIRKLDMHACFAVAITVTSPATNQQIDVPVLGFGGKAGVTFGRGGCVIGLNCSWRSMSASTSLPPVVAPPPLGMPARLAYQVSREETPAGEVELKLVPVWTRDRPPLDGIWQQPGRLPAIDPIPERWRPEPSTPNKKVFLTNAAVLPPVAAPLPDRKAGIGWITDLKLKLLEKNAHGFRDAICQAGWSTPVEEGPQPSHTISKWTGDAAEVETVNLMFYSGHAGSAGWVLPTGALVAKNAKPRPQFGRGNLEWVAISACGPLQDAAVKPGDGDVFDWAHAFHGLRMLMGYASRIGDSADEGRFFVTHAQLGLPLREAWFRMARDVQGTRGAEQDAHMLATVWAAALHPRFPPSDKPNSCDPAADGLRGFGRVTDAPEGRPTSFVAVYVPA